MNFNWNAIFRVSRRARLAAVLAPLILAACQSSPQSLDVITRFFNDIAFSASLGGHPIAGRAMLAPEYSVHRMRRWEKDIRFGLFGPVPDEHRQFTRDLMRRLSTLAGRRITFVDSPAAANFIVQFDRGAGFLINQAEFTACYTQILPDRFVIGAVDIHISLDRPEMARRCLTHEILHGFGMHHTNVLNSSMNYGSFVETPTQWDELAIRAIYSPRLRAGMYRHEAVPVARSVIGKLMGIEP